MMTTKHTCSLRTGLFFLFLFCFLPGAFPVWGEAPDFKNPLVGGASLLASGAYPGTEPDAALLQTAYAGGETLRYTVSWLGIPAGELVMQVSRSTANQNTFVIEITARSAGLLAAFYPVEDRFRTMVQGRMRLPIRHEMQQKEGRRVNSKLTLYDQEKFQVSYRKNEEPAEIYQLDGPMHNEFSSFFFMRTLPFAGDVPMVVPTFADKKRHEVVVAVEGKEEQESVLGKKKTLKVQPQLKFKGLYEKVGDPLVWLTDDQWRIPTRIKARIIIGSLTADLIEYTGAAGHFTLTGIPAESPRQPPANTR